MLVNAPAWVYGALSSDTALTALLASGAGVVLIYPNDFETLPVVSYAVSQTVSMQDIWDNTPHANDVVATIDIYVANSELTRPIEEAVDAVMVGLLFNLDFSEPIGDQSAKTQHVSMRYSRMGVTDLAIAG